MLKLANSLAR